MRSMCGRFSLHSPIESVISHFHLRNTAVWKPRYNIAPSQFIPVIRDYSVLEFLTWGFHPAWLDSSKPGWINARLESITEKPAFRNSYKSKRCLIIADGYYEWKKVGNHKKVFYISLPKNKIFAFAGVWIEDTCAIITCEANTDKMKAVHTRCPVLISEDNYEVWLDKTAKDECFQNVKHNFLEKNLVITPVSNFVNLPSNDTRECVLPIS